MGRYCGVGGSFKSSRSTKRATSKLQHRSASQAPPGDEPTHPRSRHTIGLTSTPALTSLLLQPDLPSAVSHLRHHFPNSLPATPSEPNATPAQRRALLLLRTQNFLELVRARDLPGALAYARSDLGEFLALKGIDGAGDDEVNDVMAVMAYDEPEKSPVGEKMDPKRRAVVAEEVGGCVMGEFLWKRGVLVWRT
ncbi:hypothetical protein M427DRAFT_432279 [Gonapodya prolifera JEL478]|uniref:CTLH/CRA C-terminal to LisH motif domain-containing protein n=1 Tax=Gonapodya prolifera (strain JEL478) TaxID=1344416 RepID=A0A139ATQ6_GONPJ|nr:hypothetical protein M427DRAFT_432279 [Gonapodya prolifera JEL478]|eukprot:KXS19875.1 hypothetical protein M427DRAFT_432279 [Gonapodya prolifera JEL478]